VIRKDEAEDVLGISNTRKIDSRGHRRVFPKRIHVNIEHPVIVMQLIFVRILLKIGLLGLRHRSKVMNIKRAMLISAGINEELLTVTLFLKRLTTMRAFKRKFLQISFIRIESRLAYLTAELASTTGIVVYVLIRGSANMACSTRRR
jgi:hypothetical protein